MRTIWKYSFEDGMQRKIELPACAKVIRVHEQRGEICLWVEVDPKIAGFDRIFRVVGTGHTIPPGAVYVWAICCVSIGWKHVWIVQ